MTSNCVGNSIMRLVETVNRGEIIKSFLTGYQTYPYYSLLICFLCVVFVSRETNQAKQKGKPELPLFPLSRSTKPYPAFFAYAAAIVPRETIAPRYRPISGRHHNWSSKSAPRPPPGKVCAQIHCHA